MFICCKFSSTSATGLARPIYAAIARGVSAARGLRVRARVRREQRGSSSASSSATVYGFRFRQLQPSWFYRYAGLPPCQHHYSASRGQQGMYIYMCNCFSHCIILRCIMDVCMCEDERCVYSRCCVLICI